MSAENKAVARRFYESISAGRLEVIDTVVAEDFVEHDEFPGWIQPVDATVAASVSAGVR